MIFDICNVLVLYLSLRGADLKLQPYSFSTLSVKMIFVGFFFYFAPLSDSEGLCSCNTEDLCILKCFQLVEPDCCCYQSRAPRYLLPRGIAPLTCGTLVQEVLPFGHYKVCQACCSSAIEYILPLFHVQYIWQKGFELV